jgi:hypothetical protein
MTANPAVNANPPKIKKRKKTPPTAKQALAILAEAEHSIADPANVPHGAAKVQSSEGTGADGDGRPSPSYPLYARRPMAGIGTLGEVLSIHCSGQAR